MSASLILTNIITIEKTKLDEGYSFVWKQK